MADWRGVSEGMQRGFERGFSTGGGRLGHLGGLIKQVADKLRTEREAGIAMGQKRDILGMEEASKIRIKEAEFGLESKTPTAQVDAFKNNLLLKIAKGDKLEPNEIDFYNKTMTSITGRRQYEPPKAAEIPKTPAAVLPPAPTGKFNPLRALPGYASYGEDKKGAYNALRSRGISASEAKKRLNLQ